jgi:hypothetical protein
VSVELSAKINVTRGIQAQRFIGRTNTRKPKLVGDYRLSIRPSDVKSADESLYVADTNLFMGSILDGLTHYGRIIPEYAGAKAKSFAVGCIFELVHLDLNQIGRPQTGFATRP